jgi:hypothetical protein
MRKNIPDYLGEKTSGAIFATRYDDNETHKAHEETFLRGGLQRYVCRNIKTVAGLPNGRPVFFKPIIQ